MAKGFRTGGYCEIFSVRSGEFDRGFRFHPHFSGVSGKNPELVPRRSHQAGNHQLPDVQAGARWAVLRANFRSHPGLGVLVRQVQAHEAPRRHLRQVRRGSHAGARPPRAPGPRRAGQPLLARVVLQGPAQPHRPPAGHHPARTGAGALLRSLRGGGPRRGHRHLPRRGHHRREEARARPRVSGQVRRHDGRRGHQGAAQEGRRRCLERRNSREDEDRGVGPEES